MTEIKLYENVMNAIDQAITLFINGSDLLYLDRLARIATHTSTWIPLAIVLIYVLIRRGDLVSFFSTVLAIALCIFFADQMASTVCKPLFERYRPAQDPSIMYMVDVVDGYRGGLYGFFSSHAANTVSVATFLSLMFRNKLLSWWLASWAAVNCWTRIYLGVHYVGDILVGCVWGFFVGWCIYRLWQRYSPGSHRCGGLQSEDTQRATPEVSQTSVTLRTPSGFGMASVHLLVAAIALTYLYISFRALW